MNWYRNLSESEKQGFQRVVAVCAVGTVFILLVPIAARLLP